MINKVDSTAAIIEEIVISTHDKCNDEITRGLISDKLKAALVSDKRKFIIVCDETTNPPSVVDANEIRGYVIERNFSDCQEIHYIFNYKANAHQP